MASYFFPAASRGSDAAGCPPPVGFVVVVWVANGAPPPELFEHPDKPENATNDAAHKSANAALFIRASLRSLLLKKLSGTDGTGASFVPMRTARSGPEPIFP